MPKITIGVEGVEAELKRLNPNKASGPDNLSPRVLKECASIIAPLLRTLYQKSLDTSAVPYDWKQATVSPVFKKGDRYQPANYRPISLTCICSKIMEHIITSNMKRYLESNHLLHHRQHGFRAQRSCETQLVELTSEISEMMDQQQEVDACVLDFSKAFDKVNQAKLIVKCSEIGLSRQVNSWIRQFLYDRHQSVVVDGYHSHTCPVTSGVPQGSVIGPSLFLIYINDLPNTLKSKVRLFADDTILYNTAGEHRQLQEDLVSLEKWEKRWDMEFNPSKCEHITFTRKRSMSRTTSYTLHNQVIPKVDNIKYLGVKMEKTLKWNLNTDYIRQKAASTLGFIRRNIPFNLPQLRARAYIQLMRPQLEYACTAWDAGLTKTQTSDLENVQRRAARMVRNIPRSDWTTSTTGIIDDLCWQNLSDRRKVRRLGLFRAMHFGDVASSTEDFIQQIPSKGQLRRHNQQYHIPHCNTKSHASSFFISTAKLWNALSPEHPFLCAPVTD